MPSETNIPKPIHRNKLQQFRQSLLTSEQQQGKLKGANKGQGEKVTGQGLVSHSQNGANRVSGSNQKDQANVNEGKQMQKVMDVLVKPMLRRLGSLLAGALIANGMIASEAEVVASAFVIVAALAVDLVNSFRDKKGSK